MNPSISTSKSRRHRSPCRKRQSSIDRAAPASVLRMIGRWSRVTHVHFEVRLAGPCSEVSGGHVIGMAQQGPEILNGLPCLVRWQTDVSRGVAHNTGRPGHIQVPVFTHPAGRRPGKGGTSGAIIRRVLIGIDLTRVSEMDRRVYPGQYQDRQRPGGSPDGGPGGDRPGKSASISANA